MSLSAEQRGRLYDEAFFADPYRFYARSRSASPVSEVRPGTWLVTGYAEAREALAHPGLSKDTRRFFAGKDTGRNIAPALAASLLATDPPDHARLRRLIGSAFTAGRVERLRPRVVELTERLVGALSAGGAADLVAGLAIPLPVAVICELLGVPEADRDAVRGWSDGVFAAGKPDVIDAASHRLADSMTALVAAKRERPDEGLISALVAVRDADGDRLSEAELVSLATLVVIAGHETTTNLIASVLLELLTQPDVLASVQADSTVLDAVIEETLRHESPVGVATARFTTTEPVPIGAVTIPPDQMVMVAIGAANRDPARFPAPNAFQAGRSAGHLAFGHGIHHCLGAALARMETHVAVTTLLARHPTLDLAVDVDVDALTWRHTRLMRGLAALPVHLSQQTP